MSKKRIELKLMNLRTHLRTLEANVHDEIKNEDRSKNVVLYNHEKFSNGIIVYEKGIIKKGFILQSIINDPYILEESTELSIYCISNEGKKERARVSNIRKVTKVHKDFFTFVADIGQKEDSTPNYFTIIKNYKE